MLFLARNRDMVAYVDRPADKKVSNMCKSVFLKHEFSEIKL